jgi:hypothetical protein
MKVKMTKKQRLTRKKGMKIIKGGGNKIIREVNQNISQSSNSTTVKKKIPYVLPHMRRTLNETDAYNLKTCTIPYIPKVPFNCYGKEIYEFTKQSIGVQYDKKQFDYYTISPLTLSVFTMQVAFDTDSISITEDNGNYYLGFINNFPSLVIQQTYNYAYTTRPLKTNENKDIHDTRPPAKWFNVLENKDTFVFKEQKFEIIEFYKASMNYVEYRPYIRTSNNNNFNKFTNKRKTNNINALTPHYIRRGTLRLRQSTHPHLNDIIKKKFGDITNTPIYISTASNIETFEYLIEKVRQIIESIKNETDEEEITKLLYKRKLGISKVLYRAYINFNDTTEYIIENIRWIVKNALWLEKYLELRNKCSADTLKEYYGEIDNLLTRQEPEYKELQNLMYESDLSGLDSKFFIVNEFKNKTLDGGDDKEYVIVGYPEMQMKQHILNFWQENNKDTEQNVMHFNTLCNKLDIDSYIEQLFNEFIKLKAFNEGKTVEDRDKIKDKSEYYKLYMYLKKNSFEYIKQRFVELNEKDKSKISDIEFKTFKNNFENNAFDYFQKIALKYLPKPMVFIKYVFLVFNKNEYGKLSPMIFNVKELTKQHQPILKKIESLIKHELPYRFGILKDNEYNNGNGKGNVNDPFDNEYKLWYSRYRYGKCFQIVTDYLHTMSNLSNTLHNYDYSITLENLIYECSLTSDTGQPFFEDIKLEYQVREHQINNYIINYKDYNKLPDSLIIPNRSDFIFDLYEKAKEAEKLKELNKLFEADKYKITKDLIKWKEQKDTYEKQKEIKKIQEGLSHFKKDIFTPENKNKIKFILMFKEYHNTYTFIYKYDNKFYILIIESSISTILPEIIKKLKELEENKSSINFNDIVIKFAIANKCFKIVSNNILNLDYCDLIFEYNPTLVKKMKINKTELLNVSIYYNSELLSSDETITLPNLYLDKSPIYRQHLPDAQILSTQQDCSKLRLFEPKNSEKLKAKSLIINCVHENVNNCGYNFWEFLNIKEDKLLIFIVPINESEATPYLSNFMDLDGNNKNIINMLGGLIEMYLNDNYLCFFHSTITIKNNTLHFHVVKKIDNYTRNFSNKENEIVILQALTINNLINNITNCKLYYNTINYDKLKTF